MYLTSQIKFPKWKFKKGGAAVARPSKPISVQSRHNTKEEIEKRKEQEERLKG